MSSSATPVQAKPAAEMTVWGIVLMVLGNVIAAVVAYNSMLSTLTAGPFSSGGGSYGVFIFLALAVSATGFVMMLIGIHRFISRTDPGKPALTGPEAEAAWQEKLDAIDGIPEAGQQEPSRQHDDNRRS